MAIRLVVSNDNPSQPRGQKRRGYDVGFARGTLDKCSGKPPRALDNIPDTKYNRGYVAGYLDGYCSNDSEF